MTCHSVRELMQPYHDGEVDPGQKSDVEYHLQSCPECAEMVHGLSELRTTVRAGAPYYAAPEELEGRVRKAVRRSAASETRRPGRSIGLTAAATLAIAASIVLALFLFKPQTGGQDLVAQEVVSSHVRSLMANHLLDVTSTDQHTVKPWFAGKIDFSPQVKDLAAQGYRLIGGRLDYVDKRPVAALVYQRRQHIINLFVWPAAVSTGSKSRDFAMNGFNMVHWPEAGLSYWAISDLNSTELREFVRLYSEE